MAGIAQDLALGELSFPTFFCPRPDVVTDLRRRVDVMNLQVFPGPTLGARPIIFQPLLSTALFPSALMLTLFVRVFVGQLLPLVDAPRVERGSASSTQIRNLRVYPAVVARHRQLPA